MDYRILSPTKVAISSLQLKRIMRGGRLIMIEQLSPELAAKFYPADHRKQSKKPKGYHSWKTNAFYYIAMVTPGCS